MLGGNPCMISCWKIHTSRVWWGICMLYCRYLGVGCQSIDDAHEDDTVGWNALAMDLNVLCCLPARSQSRCYHAAMTCRHLLICLQLNPLNPLNTHEELFTALDSSALPAEPEQQAPQQMFAQSRQLEAHLRPKETGPLIRRPSLTTASVYFMSAIASFVKAGPCSLITRACSSLSCKAAADDCLLCKNVKRSRVPAAASCP